MKSFEDFDHFKSRTTVKESFRKSSNDGYFAITDPKTKERYEIPMLSRNDPKYFLKYVDYMKLKEKNEQEFEKIMNWN